jgi:hypothetical protein
MNGRQMSSEANLLLGSVVGLWGIPIFYSLTYYCCYAKEKRESERNKCDKIRQGEWMGIDNVNICSQLN